MNFFTAITAPMRGGHKFLAHEYIMAYLKSLCRNSGARLTLPFLQLQVDQCRPAESDLIDLLFTKQPPQKIPKAGDKKMAQYHILWFLTPFVRQGEAKELADLMKLMEKCLPTEKQLHNIIKWWNIRHGIIKLLNKTRGIVAWWKKRHG